MEQCPVPMRYTKPSYLPSRSRLQRLSVRVLTLSAFHTPHKRLRRKSASIDSNPAVRAAPNRLLGSTGPPGVYGGTTRLPRRQSAPTLHYIAVALLGEAAILASSPT